jgi:hypothetical protein
MIAMAEVVLGLESTAEITSKTNTSVQIVDLITFVIRKIKGFNLCRARRIISVIVRIRQIIPSASQTIAILSHED